MKNPQAKKDLLLTILVAVVGFSIPFVLYWNELLAGNTFVNGDGLTTIVPDLPWMKNAIVEGEFPLWNPYLAGGTPRGIVAGAPGLYPFNWLLVLVPVGVQLYAFFALHLAMGGAFMFRYLRCISCSPFVATMVSTMYLFTVHMGGYRKEHEMLILAALYVPVILYFAEGYLQRRKLKWLFLCAGAMALQLLGGFLQYAIYTDIAAFFYLLAGAIHRKFEVKKILKHGILWVAAYFGMVMLIILPTAHFMLYLAGGSGEAMEYDTFKSVSLHPVKLLMAVIPQLFGADVWSGLIENNYSSGMDAELVLGVAAVALLLASFTLWKKDFRVRVMTGLLAGSLVYACMGNIPFVAQIVYRIPALNMFRVPSRALFIATFSALVLIGCAMERFGEDAAFARRINLANAVVAALVLVVGLLYALQVFPCAGERLDILSVFKVPVALLLLYLAVFYGCCFARKRGSLTQLSARNIVSAGVAVIMIIQVMPYYSGASISNVEQNWAFSDEFVDEVGTYKVWSPDGSCRELVFNSAATYPIQGLNAYTNLNLGNLYKYCMSTQTAPMNRSGLYNSFPTAGSVLSQKNDLVSMMGAKYIMLSPETDAEEYGKVKVVSIQSTLLAQEQVDLLPADTYQVAAFPVDVQTDKYYRISFTVDAEKAGDTIYTALDFGGEYHPNHVFYFATSEGKLTCTAIFRPVGDDPGQVTLRIVALTLEPLNISNILLEEVDVEKTPQYCLVSQQDGYNVYENLLVQDLIYAPKSVATISEDESAQLYLQTQDYDILNTSYLTEPGLERDYSNVQVEISNIELKNNRVTAQVRTDGECFINLSQTYYPGWKAFVDGEETELYEVNGIIQGCFVPEGDHTVEFRFAPAVFYLGAFISAVTIIACAACVCGEKYRAHHRKAQKGTESEER